MTKVTANLILLVHGERISEFGMLLVKLKKLKEYIEEPLKELLE